MTRDIALWKDPNGLSEDERRIVKRNLGFRHRRLAGGQQHRAGHLPPSRRPNAASFCCARRLKRPSTPAYQYIVESLGLDEEIFNVYHEVASIRDRMNFSSLHRSHHGPGLSHRHARSRPNPAQKPDRFACLMEGLFFYVGFTQILALGGKTKWSARPEQYQYILRDESMHCNFGIDLINQLKTGKPHLWTDEFKADITALFHRRRAGIPLRRRHHAARRAGPERQHVQGYLRYRQPPRHANRARCAVPERRNPSPG